MKLKIYTDEKIINEYIDIHCRKRTDKINAIVTTINETFTINIIGYVDNSTKILSKSEILYFESVDKRCFAYTKENAYLIKTTLKELEEKFNGQSFIRINKSTIVNLYKVQHLKSDLNMRTIATLNNGEKLLITRHYKNGFSTQLHELRNQLTGGTNENN